MSENQKSKEFPYDDLYQRYNSQDLNNRSIYDTIFQRCKAYEKAYNELVIAHNKVLEEKKQWSKVNTPGNGKDKPKIIQKAK